MNYSIKKNHFLVLFLIPSAFVFATEEGEEGKCLFCCDLCGEKAKLFKEELDKEKKENENLKKMNEGLEKEKNLLQQDNNQRKLKENELEQENRKLAKEKETLEQEKGKLEEDKETLEKNNRDLEEKKKNLEGEKISLQQKNEKLEKKIEEIDKGGVLEGFAENNRKLEEEIKKNEEDKQKFEEEKKKIEEEKKKIELKAQEDISKIKKDQEKLKQDLEKKIQELQDLNKKIDALGDDINKKDKKINELNKKLSPTEIGLQNIGATCYMNATLQALSNTDKFTEYFLYKYKYNPNEVSKKMSNEMYKVLLNLWDEDKKKGDYPPYDFKNALSEENSLFAGVQANDSKDLINFLLERFHHELNEPNSQTSNQDNIVNQMDEMKTLNAFFAEYFSANKSIITDLFYGIVETRSRCGGCGCTKYNFQIFSFLEFPLKEVNTFMFNNGRRMSLINQDGTNPDINLYECFDYYQKIDLMNGQNQMYCNICNFNRDTYYGSTLYSLPNFLIINLNRGKGAVYQCNVKFPETLNLLNYVTNKDKTVLQLYAVICHYGPSSMSGHFIAYCKHRKTKKWYQYNDSTVTECTQPNEYNNGMPYILFYQAI